MNTLYNSKRKFRIWVYTVSHSSLLLRSEMKYPDQEEYSEETAYNIDLEFWAVSYMNIPTDLLGIIITEITVEELPIKIDKELLMFDMRIFELESEGFKYHIIAGGLLIGKNKWINRDRIFNSDSNLEHDKIIFQSNL